MRGIEPVASPHFAVVWRSEEAINLFFVGVLAFVADEGIDFFDSGREASEIETQATEKRDAVGFRRRCEAFFFEAGEDETVDGVLSPGDTVDGRERGALRRDESPMCFGGGYFCADFIRPLRALLDPSFESGDLIVGEAATHGHAGNVADAGDTSVKGAGRGVARNDHFGEDGLFGVEAQAGHLCVGTVAGDAGAREDGLDVADEVNFFRSCSNASVC